MMIMESQDYKMYESLPGDFYDESLAKSNPVTRHYHGSRYAKIRKFIGARFREGMRILDVGSGSSSWNTGKLPVTAIDINQSMLGYGRRMGYIKEGIQFDLDKGKLPIEDGAFDFVVFSEVLEHLHTPQREVREACRVLKKGGFIVVTVPLDTFLSPWQVLFELGCFLRGNILGNDYFRKRCGHIQHFSVAGMASLLEGNGFRVVGKDITLLNIGMIAEKE